MCIQFKVNTKYSCLDIEANVKMLTDRLIKGRTDIYRSSTHNSPLLVQSSKKDLYRIKCVMKISYVYSKYGSEKF